METDSDQLINTEPGTEPGGDVYARERTSPPLDASDAGWPELRCIVVALHVRLTQCNGSALQHRTWL